MDLVILLADRGARGEGEEERRRLEGQAVAGAHVPEPVGRHFEHGDAVAGEGGDGPPDDAAWR